MGDVPYSVVAELFAEAADLPGDSLAQFLDQVGARDWDLRCELEAMLAADSASGIVAPGEIGVPAIAVFEQTGMPDRIGDYEILGELGRGGMGVVYRARHRQLHRIVALKTLLMGRLAEPQYRARFRCEAEAIARLQHPNIVQIFEIAEHQGQLYFTLEYVSGGSLDKVAGKPQSQKHAAAWVAVLAEAIHYAHQQGIVHRDLKPANVLLADDGVPKITDFGVAKLLEGSDIKTASGLMVGTPEYMAPEQADDSCKLGPSADIYALGAVLYCLLTGRPPFQSETALATLHQMKTKEPVSPRRLLPQLSRDLEVICLKCLEKEPANRYATAADLSGDLRNFLQGRSIRARPVPMTSRLWRWSRRNPAIAAMSCLVAILLIAVSIGAVIGVQQTIRSAAIESENDVKLARELYRTNIAFAQRECAAGNMLSVGRLLDQCAKEFRGWEWNYLQRRRVQNDVVLRLQPEDELLAVAFSPDGQQLAATTNDGRLGLWSATRPDEIIAVHHGLENARNLSFHPSGQHVVVLDNHDLTILDTKNLDVIRTLPIGIGSLSDVLYTPDGRYLVAAGVNKLVCIYNLQTDESRILRGHQRSLAAIAVDGRSRWVASASNDHTVRIWEMGSGKERMILRGHETFIRDVVFSPDGSRLASSDANGRITIWGSENWQSQMTLPGSRGNADSLAFSPDGTRLASGGLNRAVSLWDTESGRIVLTLDGHADSISDIEFSPSGDQLVSTSIDRTLRVWGGTSTVNEISAKATKTLSGHESSVECVSFSSDGRLLCSASTDATVRIWDLAAGLPPRVLEKHPGQVWSAAFSPVSGQLASICGDRKVRLWDSLDAPAARVLGHHPQWGGSIVFDPSGQRLASASHDGTVKIWDTTNGDSIQSFRTAEIRVNGLAFSSANDLLAIAHIDSTVRLCNPESGETVRELRGHTLTAMGVAFSSDGTLLASCSRDKTVKIWNPQTGQLISTLFGHTDRVYGVAFGPDDQQVASAGADGTIRFWNLKTGAASRVLRGHDGIITCVAFSPDGQWLASGGRDKTIKIWQADVPASESAIEKLDR